MLTVPWIVVGHGVRKRIVHIAPAVCPLVDVKSKNPFLTGKLRQRQAVDLSPDDNPPHWFDKIALFPRVQGSFRSLLFWPLPVVCLAGQKEDEV